MKYADQVSLKSNAERLAQNIMGFFCTSNYGSPGPTRTCSKLCCVSSHGAAADQFKPKVTALYRPGLRQ